MAVEVVIGHIEDTAPVGWVANIDDISDKALCAGLTMDETGLFLQSFFRLRRGQ
jgi:hypothetical protein